MFDKLKEFGKLKELQENLEKEIVSVEKEGIFVKANGKMEVEEIRLNRDLSNEKQEVLLKECINEAFRKVKMNAVQKLFSQEK